VSPAAADNLAIDGVPEMADLPPAAASSPPVPIVADASSIGPLTAGMAAGDGPAVEAFYRRYFGWLYREARRATGRRDEAFCLDVVHDAVLRVVRTVRRVDSAPQFAGWLKLVVRTTAYDLLRAESRRQRREAQRGPPAASDEEPADAERLAWLRRRIASLDPKLVRMIELRFEARWSLGRIAALFGVTIGTVDGRLRRALSHLREMAREELCDD
jgi:RNA polymerase sigma factor (sigma-70 family)